jgi:hypothetical protein
VQLRFKTGLTSEQYVSRQAWRGASLERCPLHPRGGCSFARHGTYERVTPPGTRIPRWYCPKGHGTFSLLADCFAARLPGSLAELEAVVVDVEQAKSLERAADRVRSDDVTLPSAIRWTRRRVQSVHAILTILIGLLPEHFCACQPNVSAFRQRLNVAYCLPRLREIAQAHLHALPTPLGFAPRPPRRGAYKNAHQHSTGPDPPSTQ